MPIIDPSYTLLGPLIAALAAVPLLWLGMRAERRYRLMNDMPTSSTAGVFIGYVELEGVLACDDPYTSYITERACAYYSYSIEERWSRWETESYTDSKGNRKTRSVHKSGWTTVDSGGETQAFFLRDADGIIQVQPDGATLELTVFTERTCGTDDPLYYDKGPDTAIMNSDHRRRFTESGLAQGDALYVIGQSRVREDAVAAEIAADPHVPLFLISTREQQDIASSYRFWSITWLIIGLTLTVAIGSLFVLVIETPGAVQTDTHITHGLWATGAYLGACWCGWMWMVYNSITELRNRVTQAWANIDVELKRRADLIPKLVQIVTALAGHEQHVLQAVTLLRTQLHVTKPGRPGADAHACSSALIALQETYPAMTTNDQFHQLSQALTTCEDRIALARAYFNDMATHYNTRLEIFPDNIVGTLTGAKQQPLMQNDGFTHNAPIVKP